MVVRRASRSQATRAIPRSYWIVGLVVILVLMGGSALVWRGCSRRGPNPYAAWGGMSKEEFLKKRKQREEEEAKQEAEAAKRANEEKKKRDEEAAAKRLAEEKQKKAENKAKPQQRVVRPNSDDEDGSGTPEPPPQLPPVPNEFAAWKDFDFFVARLTNHPQLPRAVEHRSNSTPRDERQAEFLEKLLVRQLPAGLEELVKGWRSGEDGDRDVPSAAVEAITIALARNGTAPAQRTLAALLAGTLTAVNDQAATVATLRALALNPSEENNRLLAQAVFEPEKIRAAGRQQMAMENLRQQAVAALAEHGKGSLRLLAARRFVDPSCPPEARKLLTQVWLQPHPENLEAYVFLNERPEIDAQVRSQILRRLVELSGQAVRHFLGGAVLAPPTEVPPNVAPDPELPYRIARQLWKADLARVIDARRTTIRSMDEARDWVLLAATVPRSDVRSRLVRLLERRWEEGPPVAIASGGYGREPVVVEPGILAVIRSARLKRLAGNQAAAKARGGPAQRNPPSKDPWLDFEEAVVRDFCQRFSEAAALPNHGAEGDKPASRGGGGEATLPIALHPRAEVVAEYCVRWPGSHAEKLASIAPEPMDVCYVRIEQKARPMSVRGHYERTVKGQKIHPIKDGVWLETLLSAKDGSARSIDVLLTRANPKAEAPPDETQEITVEILSVAVAAMETTPARRAGANEPTETIP